MPVDPQTSFAAGEIDPELHGRTDLVKYKTGAKTLRNMTVSPRGAPSNRPGTRFVALAKETSMKCRLIAFVPSADSAYVLEFGNLYVRFYKNGSQILSAPSTPYTVTTPYTESELRALRFARSADTLYIAHPNHKPQTLQRFADATWTLADYAFKNGPYMPDNTDEAQAYQKITDGGGDYILSSGTQFQSTHVGGLLKYTLLQQSKQLTDSLTGTGVVTESGVSKLWCGGPWKLRTHGTWTGTLELQKSVDNGATWTTIHFYRSNGDVNFDTFGTESLDASDGDPFLIRANVTAYTGGTIIVDLEASSFETNCHLRITSYVSNIKVYVSTDSDFFKSLDNGTSTTLWAEGSWSDYRGWPSCVTFFQDRLCFAATTSEPQSAWFTKTSNYIDYGRSIPLVDSDGITINLLSRQINPIVNVISALNTCVFFSSFSYWSVTSPSGGSITPTSIAAKVQESRGINAVDPMLIGDRLLFIESRGCTVRDIDYKYLADKYESENISILSDHLFRGYEIVDMAYAQSPDSLLWLVRDDGDFLCCTYLREQEMLAWTRHDTAGDVESICTIPGTNVDELWMSVKRNNKRMIERMTLRTLSTDPADQYFVDCGIPYDGGSASSLTGYDHLNGLTVIGQCNGFPITARGVTAGAVTVPAGTTKAAIGLAIVADFESLDPEIQMQDGPLQGRKYQINRCGFRLLSTSGGYVGADFDHLDPVNIRGLEYPAIDASDPTPLFTGILTRTIRPGASLRERVCYRQTDPMPVTILSVLPIVDPGQTP